MKDQFKKIKSKQAKEKEREEERGKEKRCIIMQMKEATYEGPTVPTPSLTATIDLIDHFVGNLVNY